MIQLAISLKVAKLSELCIDGTKVRADASRFKTYKRENVSKLIEELDSQTRPHRLKSWKIAKDPSNVSFHLRRSNHDAAFAR